MRDYDGLRQTIIDEQRRKRQLQRYAPKNDDGQCDLCSRVGGLVDGLCIVCRNKFRLVEPL